MANLPKNSPLSVLKTLVLPGLSFAPSLATGGHERSRRVAIIFWPCWASFTKPCRSRRRFRATFVPADSIPQPQHDLLVHFSDMTSTLTRYHGEPVTLKVLQRHQGPQWYRRHIVLETEDFAAAGGIWGDADPLAALERGGPTGSARRPLAAGRRPGPAWAGLSPLSRRIFQNPLEPPDRTIFGTSGAAMALWPLQLHERRRRPGGRRSRGNPAARKRND